MFQLGDDFGFDRKHGVLSACRGAVGLVNKPQTNSRKRRKLRSGSLITCA